MKPHKFSLRPFRKKYKIRFCSRSGGGIAYMIAPLSPINHSQRARATLDDIWIVNLRASNENS